MAKYAVLLIHLDENLEDALSRLCTEMKRRARLFIFTLKKKKKKLGRGQEC